MTRKLTLARAKKILKVVPQSKSFWICTNEYLRSLNTLADALERVSDDVFRYHVDKYKNDFATWVKDAVDDKDLAREISRIKTRYTLIRKIRENTEESKALVRRYKKVSAKKKPKHSAPRKVRKAARKQARKPIRKPARKARASSQKARAHKGFHKRLTVKKPVKSRKKR
jgi:hypothetical protein